MADLQSNIDFQSFLIMVQPTKLESVIERMQNEDADQRKKNLTREKRLRSISRDTAETLSVLARSMNAKNIVEIGTSHGYSTIWLGLVAKETGGKVISFEIDQDRVNQAMHNIKEAGLDDIIEIHCANPITQPELLPDIIDLVFLDAEKEEYLPHFKNLFSKLRDGGTVIADNIVSHFRDVRDYVEFVRNHDQCNSIMLSSIGKGLEITYKRKTSGNAIPWNQLVR